MALQAAAEERAHAERELEEALVAKEALLRETADQMSTASLLTDALVGTTPRQAEIAAAQEMQVLQYRQELIVLIKGAACGSVDDDVAAVVGASAAVVKHVDKDFRDHVRALFAHIEDLDGILHLLQLCWKARVPVISLWACS